MAVRALLTALATVTVIAGSGIGAPPAVAAGGRRRRRGPGYR